MQQLSGDTQALALASIHLAIGQIPDAIECLQTIPATSAHNADSQQMLVRAFFEQSRYDQSIQVCRRFMVTYPTHPNIKAMQYWMGLAQFISCDADGGVQAFDTVLTYDRLYLNTQWLADCLRDHQFLYHQGLMVIGSTLLA